MSEAKLFHAPCDTPMEMPDDKDENSRCRYPKCGMTEKQGIALREATAMTRARKLQKPFGRAGITAKAAALPRFILKRVGILRT